MQMSASRLSRDGIGPLYLVSARLSQTEEGENAIWESHLRHVWRLWHSAPVGV